MNGPQTIPSDPATSSPVIWRHIGLLRRFASFVVVGGIATTAHYIVLVVLCELGGLAPTPASALGFTVGAIVGYALNYRFTFGRAAPHRQAGPRFVMTALAGLALNSAIMMAMTEAVAVHYLVAQVTATVVCLFWNFIVNQYWSFRGKGEG